MRRLSFLWYTLASFKDFISINWAAPHTFSEDERYIFERLLQTLPAVIATRRVYLSEQEARAENELLYTVGKDINRAKSDREVMEAVASASLNHSTLPSSCGKTMIEIRRLIPKR